MKPEEYWAWTFALVSVFLLILYTDSKVNKLERELHDLRHQLDSLPYPPIPVGVHPGCNGGQWGNSVTFI